jgi:hypothetical protein
MLPGKPLPFFRKNDFIQLAVMKSSARNGFCLSEIGKELFIGQHREVNHYFFAVGAKPALFFFFHGGPVFGAGVGNRDLQWRRLFHNSCLQGYNCPFAV